MIGKQPGIHTESEEVENINFKLARIEAENAELKEENERLKGLITLDYLTGILNRGVLDKELAEAKERLKNTKEENEKRKSHPGHILFFIIDVDNLKIINDGYGHHKGDEALKLVASCLEEEAIERGGKAARVGGDEFAILQESTGILTAAELKVVSLRIQDKINSHLFILNDGKKLGFTISVGSAILNQGEDKNINQLKIEADQAMYKKKNG